MRWKKPQAPQTTRLETFLDSVVDDELASLAVEAERERESRFATTLCLAVVVLAVRSVDRLVWRDGSDISSCTLLNCQSSVLFGAMVLISLAVPS